MEQTRLRTVHAVDANSSATVCVCFIYPVPDFIVEAECTAFVAAYTQIRARASRDITERPHAPSGVAAFMSAHSKIPYSTPSMDFSYGKGVVWGRRGQHMCARAAIAC